MFIAPLTNRGSRTPAGVRCLSIHKSENLGNAGAKHRTPNGVHNLFLSRSIDIALLTECITFFFRDL